MANKEMPYENSKRWVSLTVLDLVWLCLRYGIWNFEIKFDSFCGSCDKSDLRIDYENKTISVNG